MAQLAEITADFATARELELHGHRVTYRTAGSGPVVLLVHGIAGSSEQWGDVAPILAEGYTVVAPDLLGHGQSAKPIGDYSLGAYAVSMRDLLIALGHRRATVVGHSLGGGIAMQFAYEYPVFCERLVVVSSGGLGREVHPLLRAATLPGAELVLPLIASQRVLGLGGALGDSSPAPGCAQARTSRRWPAATHRSPTPRRGGPSSTRSVRSSTTTASG